MDVKGFVVRSRTPLSSEILKYSAYGLVLKAAFYPMERVKLIYQVQILRSPSRQLRTIPYCLATAQSQGFRSLWRGFRVQCMRSLPTYALLLASYSILTDQIIPDYHNRFPQLNQKTLEQNIIVYGMAGAFGGLVSTLLIHPYEVLHTRLASDVHPFRYSSFSHALIQTLFSASGFTSLWRSLLTSLYISFVYRTIQFSSYAFIKHTGIRSRDQVSFNQLFFCATLSSLFAQSITHPADLTRRILIVKDELRNDIVYWKQQPPNLISPTLGIEGELHWREKVLGKIKSARSIVKTLGSHTGGVYKGFFLGLLQSMPFAFSLALLDLELIKRKEKKIMVYPLPPPFDWKQELHQFGENLLK